MNREGKEDDDIVRLRNDYSTAWDELRELPRQLRPAFRTMDSD